MIAKLSAAQNEDEAPRISADRGRPARPAVRRLRPAPSRPPSCAELPAVQRLDVPLELRHPAAETSIATFSATTPVTTCRSAETTPTEPGTNTRRPRVSRFSTSASAQASTEV